MKIVLVTNTLAPYRTPVFSQLNAMPGATLQVLACTAAEPNRDWDWPPPQCALTVMRPHFLTWRGRYIHVNLEVLRHLRAARPEVIVIDGYNPTHLLAYLYARRHGIALVQMTDGTLDSEQCLTALHRLVRRVVLPGCQAYVAASEGGQALYDRYGASMANRFTSCLAVDNAAFELPAAQRQYDLMTCGRIEAVKQPGFALALALALARRCGRRMRLLVVGGGSELDALKARAALYPGLVEAVFTGPVAQRQLPALYASARVFLLPSRWDPWGVVVNEACAAGLPVLITPHAGAAGELVRDGENGRVLPLDLPQWVDAAHALLSDPAWYQQCSARSRALVAGYSYAHAAAGLYQACRRACSRKQAQQQRPDAYRSRPRVLIVERQLLHYRVEFYRRLQADLAARGIELQLLVGEGTPDEKLKRNEAYLEWSVSVPTRYLLRHRVCWQPYGAHARAADLVVVMHENKILYNLWLLLRRPRRLAFWGHGANLQSLHPQGWKERFKRWTVRRADWWFAYTDISAGLIAAAGFPAERTTVVLNAVDTTALQRQCAALDGDALAAYRRQLGLGPGPVAVYVGSLYKEKRLAFLIEAAELVRRSVPGFQLLIVGAGPEQPLIDAATVRHDWIHALGSQYDHDKARVLGLSDLMLNPGLVGLGILDSFSAGSPMFTTDCGLHSPEIAYLEDGRNGVITANDVDSYAGAIVAALQSPPRLARLRAGARASAARYTLEAMAQRLSCGIANALATA